MSEWSSEGTASKPAGTPLPRTTADEQKDQLIAATSLGEGLGTIEQRLTTALGAIWAELASRASTEGFLDLLIEVFAASSEAAAALASRLSCGETLGLRYEIETASEMGNTAGAFAAAGDNGPATIYINGSWARAASDEQLRLVLLEEIGHSLDVELNGSVDTAGDEGELFAAMLTGSGFVNDQRRQAMLIEDDTTEAYIDGQNVSIETAIAVYFSEDFASSSSGWSTGPEWQIGSATASSGQTYGNPDPEFDNSPTTDNGIAGVVIGGNASTAFAHDYYYLTSPAVDISIATRPIASFFRWLNSDFSPSMQNTIDIYNGTEWLTIWSSDGDPGIQDNSWSRQAFDISPYKSASTRIRFGFKLESTAADTVSSWNLDDVTVYEGATTATNLNAPETYTEDTPLDLSDSVVSTTNGSSITVTLSLSDPGAGSLSTATSGSVLSTFSDGVWTASGPVSDVNALLAGVTYTPRTNLSSSFIISTSVTDGIDPALTGIKTITGIAVNDIPVITNTTAALAGWLTEASTLADGSVIPGTSSVSGTPAASDADPGATQTWSILPGGPSTYGSISIDPASGVWIYHLDNARPATQGLKSNETVTQIYSARITDDSSAYIDQTITVSINGSNDAPVISLDFADSNSASLSETNVTLSASGSLSIADSDRGDIVNTEHTLIVSGTSNRSDPAAPTDAELLSMLTLTDNPSLDGTKQSGTLLWSFDSNIASPRDTTFNYLGFGETLILTYTITATDDGSPALSDSENLTITISGSNETPLITAGSNTTTLAQAAANLTTSGSVTVIDADTPDTVSASVVSVDLSGSFSSSGSTLPSSLSANSNQALLNMLTLSNPAPGSAMAADQAAGGSRFDWTFTTGSNGDAAFDFLREGETLVLTYTLDLTDNSGDAATQTSTTTVAITLTGTNESPLISDGADSASLSETNASISSSGSITVTDIDLSDTITATVDAVAISGGSYTTRSGYNRSNDIPLTDAELKAMLALSVSSATTSTIPANPPNGSDVTWSFTSGASGSGPVGGNKDFEFLAAGESIQLTYTVLVQDNAPISSGQNAKTDSTTVVVTITGTNDTPDITVVDVSGAVTEDTSTTAAGNAIAQVSTLTLSGLYESGDALTASVNGVEVTYTVQAADVDSSDPAVTRQTVASRLADAINSNANLGDFITAMAAGSVLSISSDIPGRAFTLMTSAAAAAGGSDDTQAASMTAQTANASGQQLRDSGSISFTDRDLTDLSHVSLTFISSTASTGASLSAALDAALRDLSNSFTISGPGVSGAAADGSISWSFGIDNALSQYLGANQSITAIYRISISDDSGFAAVSGNDAISTASQDVTITITGANDGPMISLQTGNSDVDVISETDAGLNRTGSLTVSDVDLTNTVSVSVQGVNATGGINGLTSTNAQLLAMLSLNPAASSAVLEKNEVVDQLNWSFDSGAEAFNHLAYGEKLHLTYTLRATDSSGASFDKTLGFTISGSNDLPSITITTADTATGALTEGDSPLTSNGTLSVADKDFSNIVSASVVSVQKAGITNGLAADDTALKAMLTASPTTVISSNNTAGTLAWSFNSGIEYFNHLGAGEQMTLTYTVRVSDSSGGTADQAIQLTITGSNDAPQLTIAPVAATEAVSAATQDLSISGTLSILDKDQGSIDVTPFVAPVPMRAVGVIRPPSIAGGLPGA